MAEKRLTLTQLHKEHQARFNEQTKVRLSNGSYIVIQRRFERTRIADLLVRYMELMEQARQQEMDPSHLQTLGDVVFHMLVLKQFTNLASIPDDPEKMTVIFKQLVNLELLGEIFNHFDKEELDKMEAQLRQAVALAGQQGN
ncbi:hypothetical protein [Paenibacillus sp. SYP-B4298]|uniref:hypothetical protein n=1 Tax=Paenibacillus sp. SYP-B4298 TaxID=2996034 RepID=UPI0022DD1E01|nr:hypothetical protein [Paenibacillus sp. SYP-B4298]